MSITATTKDAEKAGREGKTLIIAGDPEHPEVKGIIGWASDRAVVVDSPESAEKLNLAENEEIVLAAQTTFHARKFENIVEILRERGYYKTVMNTV